MRGTKAEKGRIPKIVDGKGERETIAASLPASAYLKTAIKARKRSTVSDFKARDFPMRRHYSSPLPKGPNKLRQSN